MGKAIEQRKNAAPVAQDELDSALAKINAKGMFISATANMGFRLAVTVVVPIVAGVKLDEHFHSSPSWTLTGLFLAAAAGSAAVWSTIKQVNKEQAETENQPEGNKRNNK
jgi:F0F1-type ATP synthase assembly protein I